MMCEWLGSWYYRIRFITACRGFTWMIRRVRQVSYCIYCVRSYLPLSREQDICKSEGTRLGTSSQLGKYI
jgi:hypothetical protein